MTTLNLLKVWFDIAIKHQDLPTFKSALPQGLASLTTVNGTYPLIQYKTRFYEGRQRAMMIVIGDKIIELKEQLSGQSPKISMNGKEQVLKVGGFKLLPFPLRTDKGYHTYNLFNYQVFSAKQYAHYLKLESTAEQAVFMQKALVQDLTTFVQGVDWSLDPPIDVKRPRTLQLKSLTYQGETVPCFDLRFRTNLWIPEHIGLGRGVDLGFGVLRLPKREGGSEEVKE